MRFDIISIFPEIFSSYFNESIIKRAITSKKISINTHNPRDFSKDKHKKVDDIPYGGGAGMVMTPEPLYDCIKSVQKINKGPVIYLSPKGETFTQHRAERLNKQTNKTGIILLCGRYEGIDQRVIDLCVDKEISIGKYIVTGGELGAMIIVDTLSRLIPGVLGNNESAQEESFSRALKGKKEYPLYTRPETFKGLKVPDVLKSGHHLKIKKWKQDNLQ